MSLACGTPGLGRRIEMGWPKDEGGPVHVAEGTAAKVLPGPRVQQGPGGPGTPGWVAAGEELTRQEGTR